MEAGVKGKSVLDLGASEISRCSDVHYIPIYTTRWSTLALSISRSPTRGGSSVIKIYPTVPMHYADQVWVNSGSERRGRSTDSPFDFEWTWTQNSKDSGM